MREVRTPHWGCGRSRGGSWRFTAAGFARALSCVLGAALFTIHFGGSAEAASKQPSTFGKASIFGKVNTQVDKTQPMRLQGDQLIYDKAGNRVIARGNVEIYYNDNILTADEVVYDQGGGTLTAVGNVTLKEPQGNVIRADRYTLTDDFRDGFVQSLSVVSQDQSTITADRAVRRGGNVNEFENGRFTPCKSDGGTPPLWCLSAARIIHDADAATITYQDAYFEIYGQPVFYLPYFQSPDPSVKRKSGFLTPQYGHSSTLGYITGIPYYWAIAPNYDLTLTPTYLSDQGLLMQAEWRHRLANGQYNVKLAGIDQNYRDLPPDGSPDNIGLKSYDGLRGSVETHGVFALSSWWKFGWDVTAETDDQFRRFYKLDSVLVTDRVNQVYLTGQSDRNYFNATLYQFQGLLSTDTPQTEGYTHPIINYNYVFADPVLGGELKWNTNVLSFTREDGSPIDPITGRVENENMQRVVTEFKWRRRLTDSIGISYTPFADVRGDVYSFDNAVDPTTVVQQGVLPDGDPRYVGDVRNDTVARGVVDGGMTVSYPWVANTASASHVIEPIGQIVAHQESIPQRRMPNEDAQSLVFDDTNLFATSKFSGYDRIETGTRANVGLQYTFQSRDGGYARFLAGESYHLSGDNIYLNPGRDADGNYIYTPVSGLQTSRSDYVLGVYLAPIDEFRIISQSRFDQETMQLRREDAAMVFNFGPLSTQIGYSYSSDAILVDPTDPDPVQQELLASATLRLTDRWSIGGMTRYDVDKKELRYDSVQIKYADECFALTASYIESNYSEQTIEADRTFMLRFELKHLGDFAAKTDALDFNLGGDERVN
ncbi:Organic solvent tolerance protein [Hyphomicrobium denitrificans ATCC 51888]|uniref:LPS-assembly protein LptD n=1 Tax=Hyphomicrobium denitrificans (strain ATCC 51888 / DSM 1869 / NCIMB 11706 / TK 0415) TaxID=582899 RepID=D8JYQ7_HYPDA|nr:LPS-assembly protein LptD [Hyphomicrobium denitrificans]ADJ23509.1 Organic solvent tolerance protein [Hyphomicrobium denitrificans ATCC 51888]